MDYNVVVNVQRDQTPTGRDSGRRQPRLLYYTRLRPPFDASWFGPALTSPAPSLDRSLNRPTDNELAGSLNLRHWSLGRFQLISQASFV